MKTPKTLNAILILMALSTGCGKAPELPTLTTVNIETDSEVVDSYDKDHLVEVCQALRTWVPAEKTIKFTSRSFGSAGVSIFTFGLTKVTQQRSDGSIVILDSTPLFVFNQSAGPDVCVPWITNGKLSRVD